MLRVSAYLIFSLFLLVSTVSAAEIRGPSVRFDDGRVMVSAALVLDEKHVEEIEKGVSKEIVFYVDLFRVWDTWPDEFVQGSTFVQTLHCDPVKKEYVATSLNGVRLLEKRFSSCRRMLDWALRIPEFSLADTEELEPSRYFVKVTAESRLRRLPPFINLLFFFVREKEFSVSRNSPVFPVNMTDEEAR
ncbi:MAG: DUF4390 domain-containing protein [Nitrospirota bacterium]|jgi:hypothetical protein